MENDLLEISLKLDKLALRVLELAEEQVKCRVKLETAIKPGFVHIAKSRYIMGNRSVCSLQLPTEDSSEFSSRVSVAPEAVTEGQNRGYRLLERTGDPEDFEKSNSILRKRKEKIECEEVEVEAKTESTKENEDPIKWFGVLVPQDLKLAQSSFQSTLPIVVENVNVQIELLRSLSEYETLLKRKNELSCS